VDRFILTHGTMRKGRPSDACRFRKVEMVDVIALKPGDALPAGAAAGRVGSMKDTSGVTSGRSWASSSYLPHLPGTREHRVAAAKINAEEQGVNRVYVTEASLEDHDAGSHPSAAMPSKVEAEIA
jgi:hypothetical protein